jgi:hypothetical protein
VRICPTDLHDAARFPRIRCGRRAKTQIQEEEVHFSVVTVVAAVVVVFIVVVFKANLLSLRLST